MAKNPSERPVLAILVGGGPAPGINGVISAATIEAINRGLKVLGIREGFRHLAEGRADKMSELTIPDVSRIHFNGGSILFTSRVNPARNEESMANVVRVLKERKVRYLVTIGGDDTAFSAVQVARRMEGQLSVAHVPKTIDNDLPLPGFAPTFGYETARHVGVSLVKNLMEDARTTRRWVFVVSMGRQAGHLALGICLAAGATLAVIPEEFKRKGVGIDLVGRVLEGAILKRLAMDRHDGVAVIAEGILERLKPEEIHALREAARDEHGNIRLSEIDLASALKKQVTQSLKDLGLEIRIISNNIGYELRCAPPIPFDCEYTRNLGYGVVKFLLAGGTGAMVTLQGGRIVPVYFEDILDPRTGKTRIRLVETGTETYEVARKYMIRLERADLEDQEFLERMASLTNLSPEEFKERYRPVVELGR